MVTSRDEHSGEVRSVHLPIPSSLRAVLFIPDFTMDTLAGRALLPGQYSAGDAVHNLGHAALLVAALASGDVHRHWRRHGRSAPRALPGGALSPAAGAPGGGAVSGSKRRLSLRRWLDDSCACAEIRRQLSPRPWGRQRRSSTWMDELRSSTSTGAEPGWPTRGSPVVALVRLPLASRSGRSSHCSAGDAAPTFPSPTPSIAAPAESRWTCNCPHRISLRRDWRRRFDIAAGLSGPARPERCLAVSRRVAAVSRNYADLPA